MNQRIKELINASYVKQPLMEVDPDTGLLEHTISPSGPVYHLVFDQEKFAELIIQECLEIMRLVPYETDRDFGDEIIYQEAVKTFFGVE